MPKYRVMIEQIAYTPFFKVIEAATEAEANKTGEDEMNSMTMQQTPVDLGWAEGDDSVEYEVRPEVIEKLA